MTASLALIGCGPTKGISAENIPPAGTIRFGTAYDPATFAVTGQASSFHVGSQVALVAGIGTLSTSERVTIHTTSGGVDLAVGYGDLVAGDQAIADLIPAIYFDTPGSVPFTVQDQGGNVLATGSITVTP